jgi:alkanesulfonate monooxygenase SsuD/methylene tetrahydromethanopterin reductase-like flavin-dependent oxidoreductase (luciferase family)
MNGIVFGLNVSIAAAPGSNPVGDALAAERAQFDFVSVNDHPAAGGPVSEAWTLLTWIAARTTTIAVAPRVLASPLRLPALVAKSAESLDRLSGGRVVLALGSGGSPEELEHLGADAATIAKPTTGLEETVHIVRGLWENAEFTFDGDVYGVKQLRLEPAPEHHIPIWLGTYGPRGLRLTGELADGWIPSVGYGDLRAMRERVVDAAVAAGRSEDDIRCVLNLEVRLGKRPAGDEGAVRGEAPRIVEELARYLEMGFSGFNLIARGDDLDAQVRELGEHVLPSVRALAGAAVPHS